MTILIQSTRMELKEEHKMRNGGQLEETVVDVEPDCWHPGGNSPGMWRLRYSLYSVECCSVVYNIVNVSLWYEI